MFNSIYWLTQLRFEKRRINGNTVVLIHPAQELLAVILRETVADRFKILWHFHIKEEKRFLQTLFFPLRNTNSPSVHCQPSEFYHLLKLVPQP